MNFVVETRAAGPSHSAATVPTRRKSGRRAGRDKGNDGMHEKKSFCDKTLISLPGTIVSAHSICARRGPASAAKAHQTEFPSAAQGSEKRDSVGVELKLHATRIPADEDRARVLRAAKIEFKGKQITNFKLAPSYTNGTMFWLVNFDVATAFDGGGAANDGDNYDSEGIIAPTRAPTMPKTTLVLGFSRNLKDHPDDSRHADEIQAAVAAQEEPWTRYFKPKVVIVNCNNTQEKDTYKASLQGREDEFGEPVRWVEGPNRQFEAMMRWVMRHIPEAMVFMKEFDTVPQMDNHFGNLLKDIKRNQPFYMLGR